MDRHAPALVSPLRILNDRFKLNAFRPGQEAVIDALLGGRSALAVFPTGGGKSLCYQLPALMLEGLTLVVSPLIALMKDQVDALARLGIPAARLDSSLSAEEVKRIYASIETGEARLLYVSPERLKNERFVQRLKRARISLMAVDEAHCISEWGHNFRPDYLKLADLAKTLRVERVLALTATATPAVAADIARQFHIEARDRIQTGFRRPNLHLRVTPCTQKERLPLLLQRLAQQDSNASTIVYVTLQETAERVADALKQRGYRAGFYHAGLADEQRAAVQEAFMAGAVSIVVATIAFGMGIDKADIRAVYHFNLPKSIENYVQEIGRAGRDGQISDCELFACADDRLTLTNFVYGDTPSKESLRAFLDEVLSHDGAFDISTFELSSRFDIRPLVINTALTYLELDGIIAASTPFYSEYKVGFIETPETIYARFEGERARYLAQLFGAGKPGRKWLTLDCAQVERATGQPRERMIKALSYLEEQGLIELQASGLRQGYRKLVQPETEAVLDKLVTLFETREQRDIERIDQVIRFANGHECFAVQLLRYFGESEAQICSVCNRCIDGMQEAQSIEVHVDEIRGSHLAGVRALIAENHSALRQPRQVARFLCGLPSPATARGKLRQHEAFGLLAGLPFNKVLEAVLACCNTPESGELTIA
jgi:ATP-dependent DNA helicase RecQ